MGKHRPNGVRSLPPDQRCDDWEAVKAFNFDRVMRDLGHPNVTKAVAARALGLNPGHFTLWCMRRAVPWTAYAALHDIYGRNEKGRLKHHPVAASVEQMTVRPYFLPGKFKPYLTLRNLPSDHPLVANLAETNGHANGAAPKTPGVALVPTADTAKKAKLILRQMDRERALRAPVSDPTRGVEFSMNVPSAMKVTIRLEPPTP